jgi:hypothetical protein
MKKQTAVDYLHARYMYVTWLRNRDEISANKADDFRKMYFELAKRMEKEQIQDAYWNGGVNWDEGIDALTYYNDTYGNK